MGKIELDVVVQYIVSHCPAEATFDVCLLG